MAKLSDYMIGWLNRDSEPSELPLCDFERFRYELKACDVILVEGRSRVSSVIRLVTASPWTHAALYIGRIHDIEDAALREALERYCHFPANEQLIIESHLGKGTIVNKLSVYRRDHIRICRPTGLSYQDAQQVIKYAISRLGAEYDVRQIFDLARFLFPWFLLPRRWRSSLFKTNAGEGTRTVCSTMIAEAFGFIQFPILPLVKRTVGEGVQLFRRNPKLCVPSDFDYSPHFEIIKYPFIDVGFYKDYRLLPWKGSGSLTPEEAKFYFEHGEEKPTEQSKKQDTVDSAPIKQTPKAIAERPPLITFASVAPLRRVAGALPGGGRWRGDSGADNDIAEHEVTHQDEEERRASRENFEALIRKNSAISEDSQVIGATIKSVKVTRASATSTTEKHPSTAQGRQLSPTAPASEEAHSANQIGTHSFEQNSGATPAPKSTADQEHALPDGNMDLKPGRINIVTIEKWIKNIRIGKRKPTL